MRSHITNSQGKRWAVRLALSAVLLSATPLAPLVSAQGLEPVEVLDTLLAPPPPKPLRLRIWSLVQTPLPAAKRAPALVLLLPDEETTAPLTPPIKPTPQAPATVQAAAAQPVTAPTTTPEPLSFEASEEAVQAAASGALPLPQQKPLAVAALVGLQPKSPSLTAAPDAQVVASAAPQIPPSPEASELAAQNLDQVAFASQDGDEALVEVVYVTKQRPLPKDPVQRAARHFVDLIDPSANQIRVKQTRRIAKAPELPAQGIRPVSGSIGNSGSSGTSGERPLVTNPLPASDDKCLRDLARMNVVFKPIDPFQTDKGCGMSDGVELQSIGSVALKPAAKLNCGYAKRLVNWVEGDLSRTVARTTGGQLTAIRHYSAYRCSFRSKGRLSEHALGNALDLAGIETSNQLSMNVERDWGDHLDWASMQPMEMAPKSQRPSLAVDASSDAAATAKRQIWYAITKSACQAFKLVLTPHSNKAHANHLHIDMGRWKQCEL